MIGGLFLLYVIYYKQPTHNFVKIEVSPRQVRRREEKLVAVSVTSTLVRQKSIT